MKKLHNAKVYHLVAQGCRKVNSSENSRFRYEMVSETQPEMELLEKVTLFYPFSLETGSSIPSATRIEFFNSASLDVMCNSKFFVKKTLPRSIRVLYKKMSFDPKNLKLI